MVSGYTAFSLAALTMFGQLAPASAAAENHVYSTVQTAAAGEEAHIPIFIENNTGFVSFNIYLSYDPDVLTPMSVSTEGRVLTGKGDVNDSIGGHLKNLPENTVQVTFTSSDYTNADADGLMFDLVCGISEEAQGSTAAPEVTAPEGYIVTSWNKDFSNVKSDLSVSTVYKWADEDHSATVKIDKARKNITDKGYDVTATVTNRTDEIISGRLVAVLLSENGTILAKAESAAFAVDRAADGAPVDKEVSFTVLYPKVEENPDIVFLGWINAETGEAVGDTTAYESAVLYTLYSFNETTEDPVSDIATGEYTTPQKVTLSSDTENAVIWYTLDGSDPRTSSTAAEYKEPVEISKSCTLRMYAGAVNHNDSSESSYIYVINNGETVYHIVTVTNVFDVDTGIDGFAKVYLVAHGAKLKDFTSDEFEGYEYDSLYFDEEFKEQYFENEEVIGETQTLFAKYVSKKYKVTYVDDAGKVISEQEVAYLNNAEAPKAPEHEGMVFVGWDKSGEGISADTTITAKYIAKEAYAEVSLNRRKDIYITVDGAYNKLAATITPSELSAYELRWTSSNPSAADVDEEGKITANGVGDTEITVTIVETGSSASVKVHVTGLTLSGKATAGFDSARNLRGIKAGENTAAQIKAQFANDEVTITAADGTVAADDAVVGTGARVNLTD